MSEEDAAAIASSATSASSTADSTDNTSSSTPATPSRSIERRVTVIGTPAAQNMAQFYIHHKVMQELAHQQQASLNSAPLATSYNEMPVLKTEMTVPTAHVRRIIGKGGSVIQELQRSSGAIIKMSREPCNVIVSGNDDKTLTTGSSSSTTPSPSSTAQTDADSITSVMITGDYYASITAQRQINLIVQKAIMSAAASSSSSPITKSKQVGESSNSQQQQVSTPEETVSAEPLTTAGDSGDEAVETLTEQIKSATTLDDS